MTKKIVFTDKAKDQIQKITSESKSKKYFRISVKGGGCSGFKYSFSFDDSKKDDDVEFVMYSSGCSSRLSSIKPNSSF